MRTLKTMNKNIGSRYYYEKDLVRNVQDVGRGRPSLKRASMTKSVLMISYSRIIKVYPTGQMSATLKSASERVQASAKRHFGTLEEASCLGSADLQVNFEPDDGGPPFRTPTCIACLPDTGVLIVGFDSGEVQTYTGYGGGQDGEPTPGPCFRISDSSPVLFVKAVEGWNPFAGNTTNADSASFSVSMKQAKILHNICFINL